MVHIRDKAPESQDLAIVPDREEELNRRFRRFNQWNLVTGLGFKENSKKYPHFWFMQPNG